MVKGLRKKLIDTENTMENTKGKVVWEEEQGKGGINDDRRPDLGW